MAEESQTNTLVSYLLVACFLGVEKNVRRPDEIFLWRRLEMKKKEKEKKEKGSWFIV
jgi:hypothetical protein